METSAWDAHTTIIDLTKLHTCKVHAIETDQDLRYTNFTNDTPTPDTPTLDTTNSSNSDLIIHTDSHDSNTTSPTTTSADTDTTSTDNMEPDNFQLYKPTDVTWSDLTNIKRSLIEKDSIPFKYESILKYITGIDSTLYYVKDHELLDILTDHDYAQAAILYHQLHHSSHRALHQMLFADHYWNPDYDILLLDVIKLCQKCNVYQRFRDLPVELPNFQ